MARSGQRSKYDEEEEEEQHRNPFLNSKPLTSKPQFRRNDVTKVRWDEEMSMGEIIEKKGSMFFTSGVSRNGKLYYHIEEILFLAEKGHLVLTSPCDKKYNLGEIYNKILGSSLGNSWEFFEAYKYLRSLGYIVKRHGIPWNSKNSRNSNSLSANLLQSMQINDLTPTFDVYLPNGKFRKSSPGDPNFLLCLLRKDPPTRSEVENLEKKHDGLPLKYCYVDHGRVSFFTFENVQLPALP